MVFHADPGSEEKRALKNVFHLGNAAKKGMSKEDVRRKDEADAVWRPELENYFASGAIRRAHSEEIKIMDSMPCLIPIANPTLP